MQKEPKRLTEMAQRPQLGKIPWSAAVLLCFFIQCHSIELTDMMDRAVELSDKLHFLSSSLKNDLDFHFPTTGRHIPRMSLCHTSSLKTPTDRNKVLNLPEADLLSLARSLLLSWSDPLLLLSAEAHSLIPSANNAIYSKTKELNDNSHTLSDGLNRLVYRMGPSSHVPVPYMENSLGGDNTSRLVNFHFLLSCFRRDSHKIDNILKILRCRVRPLSNAC